MRLFWLILFVPFLCLAQNVELEPITVVKDSMRDVYDKDVISNDDIQRLPVFSLEEIPGYSSGVQVNKRSQIGVQQDVSIRGSIFEDAQVNLAGTSIKDPQTGHFTLEIPFTSADIDSVEVLNNSQGLNYIFKKPSDRGGLLRATFGQHALWENLLSVNFPLREIKNRISIEHKISKGDRHDTDFDIYDFSYDSLWQHEDNDVELLFGSTHRDFGADSFYSNRFTQEEEHTDQRFLSLRSAHDAGPFTLNNSVYLRRHRDKFILNRFDPSFYTNFHTNYVYGLKSELDFRNDLLLGIETERETIDSTNLAKHYRLRKGLFAGLKEKRLGRFLVDFLAGLDYYGTWQYLDNEHFSLGYQLLRDLITKFSFDRFWRTPSFTELYYSDPANIGNPSLVMQRTNNYEWSLDYTPRSNITLNGGFFLRNQEHSIDWVKNTASAPWVAQNVGDIGAYGVDVSSRFDIKKSFLENVSFGYTYLNLAHDSPYALSKYVFDYDQHKFVGNCVFNFFDTRISIINNFAKPIQRQKYYTCDLKLERQVKQVVFCLEGINIFNKGYEEMIEIPGSGRWYKLSITYTF